jgi:hypothetical protein
LTARSHRQNRGGERKTQSPNADGDAQCLKRAEADAWFAFLMWCPKQLSWVKNPTQTCHTEQEHYLQFSNCCYNNRKLYCLDRLAKLTGEKLFGELCERVVQCGFWARAPSGIYKGQNPTRSNMVWESKDRSDPYQSEWDDLTEAIRNNQPYNEVKRGVEASLVQCLGRMAAHTGQEITFEDMCNCEHEFAPGLDKLTSDSPAPLQADAAGRYPVPQPGINAKREY